MCVLLRASVRYSLISLCVCSPGALSVGLSLTFTVTYNFCRAHNTRSLGNFVLRVKRHPDVSLKSPYPIIADTPLLQATASKIWNHPDVLFHSCRAGGTPKGKKNKGTQAGDNSFDQAGIDIKWAKDCFPPEYKTDDIAMSPKFQVQTTIQLQHFGSVFALFILKPSNAVCAQ